MFISRFMLERLKVTFTLPLSEAALFSLIKQALLYHTNVLVNSANWMPCIFMYYCIKVRYIYF